MVAQLYVNLQHTSGTSNVYISIFPYYRKYIFIEIYYFSILLMFSLATVSLFGFKFGLILCSIILPESF